MRTLCASIALGIGMALPGAFMAAAELQVKIGHVAPTSGWPEGVGIESGPAYTRLGVPTAFP